MCGIVGVVSSENVNQLLYDALQVLQHRGQDAAGICTIQENTFHLHKDLGLVRDVFRTRDMRTLTGHMGIGHCRYPTAGNASSPAEAQPFYVNSPYGIVLAHNGNLTNTDDLRKQLFKEDRRHVNTNSDSEVLLNVLAHELEHINGKKELTSASIFQAVSQVHKRCQGAYAVLVLIAGAGLLAFRDPYGIRPLIVGRQVSSAGVAYMVASESVALDIAGFELMRDVAPGEAVLITPEGKLLAQQCAESPKKYPCIFEFVYLARPDSVMDGISVYEARLRMGTRLGEKIKTLIQGVTIDVVIPIPDTSRPIALQLASILGVPYREGFIKNRYIGRTFIMPGQAMRKKSVKQKLNAIGIEFKDKNVLLVDDSIVRGTTSREIVQMARDQGAKSVYFASAAPPVRYPNVYGIDMPSRRELLATGRTDEEIAREIGATAVFYQDVEDLIRAVQEGTQLDGVDASCFNGQYITGHITPEWLEALEMNSEPRSQSGSQMDLNFQREENG